jgi:hypothetical protein
MVILCDFIYHVGEYELRLNEGSREFVGNKKGQPSNWRKASFLRSLGADSLHSLPAHDHSHAHEHNANCSH